MDELPPWRQLIPLGLQHVLAMYAGAVAVPLVVGGALIGAGKLNPGDLGYRTCCSTRAIYEAEEKEGVSAHDAVRETPQVHQDAGEAVLGSPRIPEQQRASEEQRAPEHKDSTSDSRR